MKSTPLVIGAAGLVCAAFAASLLTSSPAIAQGGVKPPQDVRVVNTPSVSLSGTPTVNIGNTVAVELDSQREYVNLQFDVNLPQNSSGGQAGPFQVPVGKRFVLTHASVFCNSETVYTVYMFWEHPDLSGTRYLGLPVPKAVNIVGTMTGQDISATFEPNTTMMFNVLRSENDARQAIISLYGYYEPVTEAAATVQRTSRALPKPIEDVIGNASKP